MSIYLKAFGGILILAVALACGKAYSAYTSRSLAELEGFTELISHVRGKISVSLATQSELLSDFECESLERCGFLPAVREGKRLIDAYKESSTVVCRSARRVLGAFFSELGRSYAGDEIRRADAAVSECGKILLREREEVPKDVKLVHTLLAAISLGILIFMI